MKNGNGSKPSGGGNLEDIRQILRETVTIQRRQAKVLLQHSEMLIEHDQRMEGFDKRMDRIGRHLEVLSGICDDLIRNKADRKKRH